MEHIVKFIRDLIAALPIWLTSLVVIWILSLATYQTVIIGDNMFGFIGVHRDPSLSKSVADDAALKGMVALFEEDCQKPWIKYEKGNGKYVVGAGFQSASNNGIAIPPAKSGESGGTIRYTLTKDQMPRHNHRISIHTLNNGWIKNTGLSGSVAADYAGIDAVFNPYPLNTLTPDGFGAFDKVLEEVGNNTPLEIIMPYIALNICRYNP